MPIRRRTLEEYGEKNIIFMHEEQTLGQALHELYAKGHSFEHTYLVVRQKDSEYLVSLFSDLEEAIAALGYSVFDLPLAKLPIPSVDRVVSVNTPESGGVLLDWVAVHPQSTVIVVDGEDFMGLLTNPNRSGSMQKVSLLNLHNQLVKLGRDIRVGFMTYTKPPYCPNCQSRNFFTFDPRQRVYFCPTCMYKVEQENLHSLGGHKLDSIQKSRLDAAVPEQVYFERAFEIAVAIRMLSSPELVEDGLPTRQSGDMHIHWPANEQYVRLRVHTSAPECEICGESSIPFLLYPGQDSPVFHFQLIPKEIGKLSIVIMVFQEEDSLGSVRLHTTVNRQIVGSVQVNTRSCVFSSLNPDLYNRLRMTLLSCGPFSDDNSLRSIFVDARISPWRNDIPQASTSANRVRGIIDLLHNQYNANQQNALTLLLDVLSDQVPPDNDCHQKLVELADKLNQAKRIPL